MNKRARLPEGHPSLAEIRAALTANYVKSLRAFLLRTMRDPSQSEATRLKAAAVALPLCHRKPRPVYFSEKSNPKKES